ncbi:MAG TPA: hypothetical protein VE890_01050 [Thermoguttaceae bacterium]|nr:hypothetical protein [Thermoguttaceae bacterium]
MYLPKKIASWLAPLIDAGKLRVDGYVPENAEGLSKNTAPAMLVVFLCEKGQHLLEKTEVQTKQDALHQVVRHAYHDVQSYADAGPGA